MNQTSPICKLCSPLLAELLEISDRRAKTIDDFMRTDAARAVTTRRRRTARPDETQEEAIQTLPTSFTRSVSAEIIELTDLVLNHLKPGESVGTELHPVYLFIEDFNAAAVRAPSGHSICLLNNRLSGVLPLINYALADYIYSTDQSEAGALGHLDIAVFIDAVRLMFEYKANIPLLDEVDAYYWRDRSKLFLCQSLMISQLLFIISHEIAHHVLGHTSTLSKQRPFGSDSPEMDVYTRSQQEEFNADVLAYEFFKRYFDEFSKECESPRRWQIPPVALVSPVLLMIYLECSENARLGYIGKRTASLLTHPPALHRRRRLLALSESHYTSVHRDFLKALDYFLFTCLPHAAKSDGETLVEEMIFPNDRL